MRTGQCRVCVSHRDAQDGKRGLGGRRLRTRTTRLGPKAVAVHRTSQIQVTVAEILPSDTCESRRREFASKYPSATTLRLPPQPPNYPPGAIGRVPQAFCWRMLLQRKGDY